MMAKSIRFSFFATIGFACLFLTMAAGCGGGKMSQLKKLAAARKKAGKSSGEEETEPQKKTTKKKKGNTGNQNAAPEKGDSEPAVKTSSVQEQNIAKSARSDDPAFDAFKQRLLKKYAEREKTLTTVKKIESVARAFGEYVRTNRSYPSRAAPRPGYTVSWRVTLLPYLGYKELYDQFDLNQRYNSPVNRRLVDLMPPEYKTSERTTKTNFVVPISTFSAYWRETSARMSRIEDGIADTVGVVIVDDEHSVTWTSPKEYNLVKGKPTKGLVGKYGFMVAVFGDGRVEKVNKSAKAKDVTAMISMDRGDGYSASIVSEIEESDFVVSKPVSDTNVVATKSGDTGAATTGSVNPTRSGAGTSVPNISSGNSRMTSSHTRYSSMLEGASMSAMTARDLSAAYNFKLASLLTAEEDGRTLNGFRWVKALQRPAMAVKWSAGVLIPDVAARSGNTNFNPIQRTGKANPTSTRPGHKELSKYTGQVGLDSMIVLRKLVNEGFLGTYLQENVGVVDVNPNQNKVGSDRDRDVDRANKKRGVQETDPEELFDGRRIPDLHYSGIEVNVASSRSYLMQVARERGIDMLLLIEVELRPFRNNEVMNICTLYAIDVARNKELWKSIPLNNLKVNEDRKNALKKDAVFEQMKKFDEFCRSNLLMGPLPVSLNRDNVLNRLKILRGKKDEGKIPFLAEAKFYLEENLILLDDYKAFCTDIIGNEKEGLEFAVGDPVQRFEVIKKYLPSNYITLPN